MPDLSNEGGIWSARLKHSGVSDLPTTDKRTLEPSAPVQTIMVILLLFSDINKKCFLGLNSRPVFPGCPGHTVPLSFVTPSSPMHHGTRWIDFPLIFLQLTSLLGSFNFLERKLLDSGWKVGICDKLLSGKS